MTVTPALRRLVQQVKDINPEAKVEYGDPDGIGFVRTVTFDAATSKQVRKALEVIDDERIATISNKGREKRLRVTVVADVRADHPDPFPIAEVNAVLSSE